MTRVLLHNEQSLIPLWLLTLFGYSSNSQYRVRPCLKRLHFQW